MATVATGDPGAVRTSTHAVYIRWLWLEHCLDGAVRPASTSLAAARGWWVVLAVSVPKADDSAKLVRSLFGRCAELGGVGRDLDDEVCVQCCGDPV